jgi:protein O-GlcNAc transferase
MHVVNRDNCRKGQEQMSEHDLAAALAAHQAGDFVRAAAGYRAHLAAYPADAAVLHLLGVLHHQQGRSAEGLAAIDQALALRGDIAPIHANRAAALAALGRDGEALAAIDEALRLDPALASALQNEQARLLLRSGQYRRASVVFRSCVDRAGQDPAAWAGLALALHADGNASDALPAYRMALHYAPGDIGICNGLGAALLDTGASHEALGVLEQAWRTMTSPWGPLLANLGNARRATGDLDGACVALRQAREAEPANATTLANLCAVLSETGALGEAIEAGQAARTIAPDNEDARINLAAALFDCGYVEEAIELWQSCRAPIAHTNALYAANFVTGLDAPSLAAQAQDWVRRTSPVRVQRPAARIRGAQLRIGFVSPDLRSHSVAWFLLPVLKHIDRRQFELHAFSELAHEDAITRRLRPEFASWTKTVGLDDETVAARIQESGIDVLIDLAGHTAGNRLAVFARRPARVQMSWLGYPGPTGQDAIDWRLSDDALDPVDIPGCERPWRLTSGCHAYALPDGAPPVATPVGARAASAAIVFGSFNNWPKHAPACLAAWAQILRATPGASLLLKNKAMADPATVAQLHATFAAHGIAPARIIGRARTADPHEHLALYSEIDVALDPFPYNGTTTTCEALAMGVPVVALRGTTPAGRVAAAFVARIGRAQWACDTIDTYIRTAIELAHDTNTRGASRRTLRDELLGSALGDGIGLARALETAWQQAVSAG